MNLCSYINLKRTLLDPAKVRSLRLSRSGMFCLFCLGRGEGFPWYYGSLVCVTRCLTEKSISVQ